MNGMGFNLLSQEEKKKKGKTFMDYAPGHVGDDNYVTTQPTIMTNTSTTSFGYSSDDENERFKAAVMEELLRIMHINNNYVAEKKLADTEKQ